MCKYRNGLRPLSFDHVFTELERNYEYNTRHKTNFRHKIHKIKAIFYHRAKNMALSKSYFFIPRKKNGLLLSYFVPL